MLKRFGVVLEGCSGCSCCSLPMRTTCGGQLAQPRLNQSEVMRQARVCSHWGLPHHRSRPPVDHPREALDPDRQAVDCLHHLGLRQEDLLRQAGDSVVRRSLERAGMLGLDGGLGRAGRGRTGRGHLEDVHGVNVDSVGLGVAARKSRDSEVGSLGESDALEVEAVVRLRSELTKSALAPARVCRWRRGLKRYLRSRAQPLRVSCAGQDPDQPD